jgi:cytochrome d ubiquinol oxidase subunit II
MLITRGVAMELVYKDDHPAWQKGMSWAWVVSSYGVALLLGVRFVNLFIKANTLTESTNSFFGLLSKVGILGGLLFISYYRTSGILWANVKAEGEAVTRLRKQLLPSAIVTALIVPILMMAFNWDTNIFTTNYKDMPILWVLPVLAMLLPVGTLIGILKQKYGLAFLTNVFAIVLYMIVGYSGIFPYMSPGITLYTGMASELTLKIMTGVAAVFVPLVIAYQGWKFYAFSHKISTKYFN